MSSLTRTIADHLRSIPTNDKTTHLNKDAQQLSSDVPMRTDFGVAISDPDNWLKLSDGDNNGPSLLEDNIAREKIHRFDHERIPERVVHARGTGAHGYFKVFDASAEKYTFAPVLTDPSRTTSVFVRFSTVQGSKGSAVRDLFKFNSIFSLKI